MDTFAYVFVVNCPFFHINPILATQFVNPTKDVLYWEESHLYFLLLYRACNISYCRSFGRINPLIHNVPKWCSKCSKIFKVCLTILGNYALKGLSTKRIHKFLSGNSRSVIYILLNQLIYHTDITNRSLLLLKLWRL